MNLAHTYKRIYRYILLLICEGSGGSGRTTSFERQIRVGSWHVNIKRICLHRCFKVKAPMVSFDW